MDQIVVNRWQLRIAQDCVDRTYAVRHQFGNSRLLILEKRYWNYHAGGGLRLRVGGRRLRPSFDLYHDLGASLSEHIALPETPDAADGTRVFDVTDSLQEWAAGRPNEGWAIVADDDVAEHGNQLRARLTVRFCPPSHPAR